MAHPILLMKRKDGSDKAAKCTCRLNMLRVLILRHNGFLSSLFCINSRLGCFVEASLRAWHTHGEVDDKSAAGYAVPINASLIPVKDC